MKKLLLVLSIFFFSCEEDNCIDESKITNNPCTKEYNPVCGCNDKTYGNVCEVKNAGVLEWKSGECK